MLANLHPRVIAPGHGRPLAGAEVEQKLPQLAAEYSADHATGLEPGAGLAAA